MNIKDNWPDYLPVKVWNQLPEEKTEITKEQFFRLLSSEVVTLEYEQIFLDGQDKGLWAARFFIGYWFTLVVATIYDPFKHQNIGMGFFDEEGKMVTRFIYLGCWHEWKEISASYGGEHNYECTKCNRARKIYSR